MGKQQDPLVFVAEMLKGAPDICHKIIPDLMDAIILEEKNPVEWGDSIIGSLLNGKGDALDQSNHRELKLTNHVPKVTERVGGRKHT